MRKPKSPAAAPAAADLVRRFLTVDRDRIVWLPRSPADFSGPRIFDAAALAAQFNKAHAGQPVAWRERVAGEGLSVVIQSQRLTLGRVCATLGVEPNRLAKEARQDNKARQDKATTETVKRLVRFDKKSGMIVWKKRTSETSPRTPKEKLAEFNERYANKPIRLQRNLQGDVYIKVARQEVTISQLELMLKCTISVDKKSENK